MVNTNDLYIVTDGDGSVEIKTKKMKATGLYKYFKDFSIGDALKTTKPDMKFYTYLIKKHKLDPKNCIMVGDRPPRDLQLAKKLGMKTVWIKHGKWQEFLKGKKFKYVDHTITDLRQLLKII